MEVIQEGGKISGEEAKSDVVDDLDSLFKPLGGFGRFQIFNMFCLSCIILLCNFSELGYVMTTAELKHRNRCLISECEGDNSTYSAEDKPWLNFTSPQTENGEFDSCLRYKMNASQQLGQQCSSQLFSSEQYQCDKFIYETEEWTIHREDWGIHCANQRYQLNLVGSLNNAGQVFGGLYAGFLQDKFGRKVALVTMTLVVAVVGAIKSFSVNYAMMVTLEILETTASVGLFNGPFVLALEIVSPSKRVLAGTILAMAYPIGEMLLGLVQYLTFDWRNTIRICYLPFLLTASFYWILPESVRWLLDKRRYDDAVAVLRKVAHMNKREFPEEAVRTTINAEVAKSKLVDDNIQNDKNSENNYKKLWRSSILVNRIFGILFVRMCTLFVYFGITLNSVSISEDKFLNFILTGLVEMPGYLTVFYLMDRIGRKTSLWSLMVLCAAACIIDAFIPVDLGWARLLLYLLGKYGASGALFVSDIYTAELFPTFMRSTMLSVSVLVGKLASIVAPQVPLLKYFYEPLPLLIFGGMSLLGSIVSAIFPETLDCKLPDTIEEAENLGKEKGASSK